MTALSEAMTDADLLARIGAKDRLAIQTLFGRYNVRLFRFILRMTRNEAIAEELTNETFLEIWRVAAKFERRSSPTTWMYAIARNKTISFLRKRSEVSLDGAIAEQIEDGADTPEDAALKTNKAAAILRCLEHLSPQHKEVIDLVYYHEKSIREVGEIVGIPLNTVKTRMFNARKHLSKLLAEHGIDRGWP